MQHQRPSASCGGDTGVREIALHKTGFDDVETHVLHLVRYFFQSFAMPGTQAWMNGLDLSELVFGDVERPSIASRIVDMLRCLGYARRDRIGAARTALMMLFQGNDTKYKMGALVHLSKRVGASETGVSEVSDVQDPVRPCGGGVACLPAQNDRQAMTAYCPTRVHFLGTIGSRKRRRSALSLRMRERRLVTE